MAETATGRRPNTLYYGDNLEILRDHIAHLRQRRKTATPPCSEKRTFKSATRATSSRRKQGKLPGIHL